MDDNTKLNKWFKESKLIADNATLLSTLKEIAVPYPDEINEGQAETLCKYLIARAQEALSKVEPETELHPIFKNITDSIFPNDKTDL